MKNKMTVAKKPNCVTSIVLGIIGLGMSFFVPAATYACSITGLVHAVKNRGKKNIAVGVVLNIIALFIAAVNTVMAVILTLKLFNKEKQSEAIDENSEEEDYYDVV